MGSGIRDFLYYKCKERQILIWWQVYFRQMSVALNVTIQSVRVFANCNDLL